MDALTKGVTGATLLVVGCFGLLVAIPLGMSLASNIPIAISYPCPGSLSSAWGNGALLLIAVATTSGAFAGAIALANRRSRTPVKALESAPDVVSLQSDSNSQN